MKLLTCFIILIPVFLSSCSFIKDEEKLNADALRLEKIFKAYSDSGTEVSVKGEVLTIYLQEQAPKLKVSFDLNDIEAVDYLYTTQASEYYYQIGVSTKKKDMKELLFYGKRKTPVTSKTDYEVFMFTNKEGALEVRKILHRMMRTV